MNNLTFGLFLFTLSNAFAGAPECDLRQRNLGALAQKSTHSIEESLTFLDDNGGTDLILFGEIHSQAAALSTYPQIITAAAGKGFDCVFLEYNNLIDARRWDKNGILDEASYNDMKTIATDEQPDSPTLAGLRMSSIDYRNQHMARIIRESFEKRECKRGLMFVGKNHLSFFGDEKTSIPKFLPKKMNVKRVNVISRSQGDVNMEDITWKKCEESLEFRQGFSFNLVSREMAKLPLYSRDSKFDQKLKIQWKDYDGVMVFR